MEILKLKSIIIEIKTQAGFNSRPEMTEGRSNEPEDRLGESIHPQEQRKKKRD